MAWNFGGFRQMLRGLQNGNGHPDPRVRERPGLFTPESVQDYLGRNFARFLVNAYARLLAGQQ